MDKYRVDIELTTTIQAETKGKALQEALRIAKEVNPGPELELTGVDVWKIRVDKDGNEED